MTQGDLKVYLLVRLVTSWSQGSKILLLTDGHGPAAGLFDLCTVAVRSRSGYLGLTAVHGPLKSSGPRQHCNGTAANVT